MVRHTGGDFINEEGVAVAAVMAFQSACIDDAKLDAPEAYRFTANDDAALS